MISFGDFRKGKMIRGENPIAKGLGVCLFDYVFVFLDEIPQVNFKLFRLKEEWKAGLGKWKKEVNFSIEI